MAITYTTLHAVTAGTKVAAYMALGDFLQHAAGCLGLNLQSIVRNADNTISITVDKAIRADHAGLWDLDGGV